MISAVARGDDKTVDLADRGIIVLKHGHTKSVAKLLRSRRVNAVNADAFDVGELFVFLDKLQKRVCVRVFTTENSYLFHFVSP